MCRLNFTFFSKHSRSIQDFAENCYLDPLGTCPQFSKKVCSISDFIQNFFFFSSLFKILLKIVILVYCTNFTFKKRKTKLFLIQDFVQNCHCDPPQTLFPNIFALLKVLRKLHTVVSSAGDMSRQNFFSFSKNFGPIFPQKCWWWTKIDISHKLVISIWGSFTQTPLST